ncbi:hypothetical protein CHUAL_007635 [Chamberlinius hualienensis]
MWKLLLSCFFVQLVLGQQQLQQSNDACQSKTGLLPHESHCDKFYICDEGVNDVRDCPNGLVFIGRGRGLKDGCGYPWDADCSTRPNRNAPIKTEHCEWLFGIFSHETSCTRYWTCWNGTAVEQFCIGGLLYNEFTHACDWPDNVGGCQKHPLCKDNADGRVPLGKSCTRFWQCIGGYPRLMRCPATLVFDKISKRCVEPPTEDCDVLTTTPHPAEVPANGVNGQQSQQPQQQQQQQPQQFQG